MQTQELSDRMIAAYKVAQERERQTPQIAARLNKNLENVARRAPLFLRHPLPVWPLRFLVRKVIRRLVLPFLMPQVEFNEAVRDTFLEMRRQLDESRLAREALEQRIDALEQRLEWLPTQPDASEKLR